MADSKHGTRVHHRRRGRVGHDGRRNRGGLRPQRFRRRRASSRTTSWWRGDAPMSSTPPTVRSSAASSTSRTSRRIFGRLTLTTSLSDLDGLRPRRRGRAGAPRPQARASSRSSTRSSRPDAILATNTSSLSRHGDLGRRPPSPGGSSGCTSSTRRRCRSSWRSCARSSPSPTSSRTSRRSPSGSARTPVVGRRQGGLHRQRAAVRLPQPRRLDVRDPVRLARGHRRRDEARLRAARWARSR